MGDGRVTSIFMETLLFHVKPERVEAFEALIPSVVRDMSRQPGCLGARVMKRFYTFDGVGMGEPPRKLTKIVKCVKYFAVFEFDTVERCGAANGVFFELFAKDILKLLIMPFDINSGYVIERGESVC